MKLCTSRKKVVNLSPTNVGSVKWDTQSEANLDWRGWAERSLVSDQMTFYLSLLQLLPFLLCADEQCQSSHIFKKHFVIISAMNWCYYIINSLLLVDTRIAGFVANSRFVSVANVRDIRVTLSLIYTYVHTSTRPTAIFDHPC